MTDNKLLIEFTYDDTKSIKNAQKIFDKILKQTKTAEEQVTDMKKLAQTKREIDEETHLDKLRRQNEAFLQRQEQNNAKALANQNSWSKKMTAGLDNIANSIKGMALVWVSSQVTSALAGAIKHADDIGDLAAAYDLTTAAVQRLSFQFKSAGTDVDQMSGFIAKLKLKQEEARGSGKDAVKAYEELRKFGVSANDDIETALNKVIKSVQDSEAGVLALKDVFGKLGVTALPVLKDIKSYSELEAKFNLKIIDENGLNTLGEFQRSLDIMSESLKVAAANFVVGFTGSKDLTDLIKAMNTIDWKLIGTTMNGLVLSVGILGRMKVITDFVQRIAVVNILFRSLRDETIILEGIVDKAKFIEKLKEGFAAIGLSANKSETLILLYTKRFKEFFSVASQTEKGVKLLTAFEIIGQKFGWLAKAISAVSATTVTVAKALSIFGKFSGILTAIFAVIDVFKALSNGANILQAAFYAALAPITQFIDLIFGTNWTEAIQWGWKKANVEAAEQLRLTEELQKTISSNDVGQIDLIIKKYEEYNNYIRRALSGQLFFETGKKFTDTEIADMKKNLDYNLQVLETFYNKRKELKKLEQEKPKGEDNKNKKPLMPKEDNTYAGPTFEEWAQALYIYNEQVKALHERKKLLEELSKEELRLYDIREKTAGIPIVNGQFVEQYASSVESFRKGIDDLILSTKAEGAVNLDKIMYLEKLKDTYKGNVDILRLLDDEIKKVSDTQSKDSWFINSGTSYQDIFGATWEQQQATIGNIVESARGFMSSFTDYSNQLIQNSIDAITRQIENENALWNSRSENLKAAGLENTAYYRMLEKQHSSTLEKMSKEENDKKASQWDSEQDSKKLGMVGDLASGIFKIWAQSGVNVVLASILSGLLTATFAAQFATVSSLKNPFRKYFGGLVGGSGSSDTQPHLLSPGEFVVNSASAKRNMSTLENINNGGDVGHTVNININGNILGTNDFIDEVLIPRIRKATKELGVAF